MPYVEVAGARLHYLDEGAGAPLFLLHGNAGSAKVWQKVIPKLEGHFRVIAHDRRGFGESERSEPKDPSPTGYAQELARFMDVLQIGTAHVAGLSLGGMVALRFALDFPDRLHGLVVVGSTANRTARPVTLALATLERDGWPKVARHLVESWFRPESNPADISEAYRIALQSSQRLREVTVRALGKFDIRDEISSIAAPTLILVGHDDQTCPIDMSATIHKRVPNATMIVIPECAHLVPVEQPDFCAQHMLSFLSTIDVTARHPQSGRR